MRLGPAQLSSRLSVKLRYRFKRVQGLSSPSSRPCIAGAVPENNLRRNVSTVLLRVPLFSQLSTSHHRYIDACNACEPSICCRRLARCTGWLWSIAGSFKEARMVATGEVSRPTVGSRRFDCLSLAFPVPWILLRQNRRKENFFARRSRAFSFRLASSSCFSPWLGGRENV